MKETAELLELVRERFDYDPETGVVSWKYDAGRGGRIPAGTPAGAKDGQGYLSVRVQGRSMKLHRIAYALHHGHWPLGEVDHKNRVRDDNRADNLRDVTRSVNQRNRTDRRPGQEVHVHQRGDKFVVLMNFGTFDSLEEAVKVRDSAVWFRESLGVD